MPSHVIMAVILMLAVFPPDETLRRYGAADREWHLVTLEGAPFKATATITFPKRTQITGQGPCNRYHATNSTPYPWIEVGPIASTRMACPELKAESAYFTALRAARVVVIEGDTMTMSAEEQPLLVFKARE